MGKKHFQASGESAEFVSTLDISVAIVLSTQPSKDIMKGHLGTSSPEMENGDKNEGGSIPANCPQFHSKHQRDLTLESAINHFPSPGFPVYP